MTNMRILALFALVCFIGFLGILIYRVPRIDLGIVVAITLCLAVYDLWSQMGPRRR